MISGHRPPKKPLGEISASEEDADKLAASERHTEDCRSRLVECERRLKQAHDFLALLKTRGDDPAVAQYSREEHDRYVRLCRPYSVPVLNGMRARPCCSRPRAGRNLYNRDLKERCRWCVDGISCAGAVTGRRGAEVGGVHACFCVPAATLVCFSHIYPFCSLATDMANASNEERELQCEISSLKAEIEAEEVVQAAAKERLAMLLDDSQVNPQPQKVPLRLLSTLWLTNRPGALCFHARDSMAQAGLNMDGDNSWNPARMAFGR